MGKIAQGRLLSIALLLLNLLVPQAHARQSQWLIHKFQEVCQSGDSKEITGYFEIKNITDETLEIKIDPIQSREYQFRFVSSQRVLRPEETATIRYTGSIFADGKFQINLPVEILNVDGVHMDNHLVDMYYKVREGRFVSADYNSLFMQRDVVNPKMGDAFSTVEESADMRRSGDYKIRMPSVQRLINMDPAAIYKIPLDTGGPSSCHGNCPQPNSSPTGSARSLENYNDPTDDIHAKNINAVTEGMVSASGTFSWKGMDSLLHPAFGWRVRAWRINGDDWSVVAEDWIQWDGTWSLSFPQSSGKIQFQYVAFNRFFTPLTSSDDTYRWVGPIRDSVTSVWHEGSWIADTSMGGARGLGEIYGEGMVLWSKLYWEGGINPLRDNSIKVYFPNTSYDCGDGDGVPWSCASKSGTIWLIPSHASRNGVMQHELSHQINYQYWGNSVPSGAGGPHNLSSCYNSGLAMMEGFANFMVFWAQSARTDNPSTGFDFAVENPSFACSSPKDTNESWVAAAFWDLHDQHFDGSDNLWFIHPGAVPAIYLTGGMKSGLSSVYPSYRSAANAEHRTIIDSIFSQNHIN